MLSCFNVSCLLLSDWRALVPALCLCQQSWNVGVPAIATPKGPWKHLLLSTALGSSSYRNPFQGHCPESMDHPFVIWPPESQEMASLTMKNLSCLMIPSLQKWPCHLFNHYTFFLVLSFYVHCFLVCSAQELWLLQVVNTIGTNPCRPPWAVGTTAGPMPAPLPKLPLLCPTSHSWCWDGQRWALLAKTNDTENEGEKVRKAQEPCRCNWQLCS